MIEIKTKTHFLWPFWNVNIDKLIASRAFNEVLFALLFQRLARPSSCTRSLGFDSCTRSHGFDSWSYESWLTHGAMSYDYYCLESWLGLLGVMARIARSHGYD